MVLLESFSRKWDESALSHQSQSTVFFVFISKPENWSHQTGENSDDELGGLLIKLSDIFAHLLFVASLRWPLCAALEEGWEACRVLACAERSLVCLNGGLYSATIKASGYWELQSLNVTTVGGSTSLLSFQRCVPLWFQTLNDLLIRRQWVRRAQSTDSRSPGTGSNVVHCTFLLLKVLRPAPSPSL